MGTIMKPLVKMNVNDCQVTLSFTEKTKDGVIEAIQSILSNAYDERVEKDLKEMIGQGNAPV